jgi:hypothetical protein
MQPESEDIMNNTKLIELINQVREYELATHWGVNLNFDKPNQKTPNEYKQDGINIMADALINKLKQNDGNHSADDYYEDEDNYNNK